MMVNFEAPVLTGFAPRPARTAELSVSLIDFRERCIASRNIRSTSVSNVIVVLTATSLMLAQHAVKMLIDCESSGETIGIHDRALFRQITRLGVLHGAGQFDQRRLCVTVQHPAIPAIGLLGLSRASGFTKPFAPISTATSSENCVSISMEAVQVTATIRRARDENRRRTDPSPERSNKSVCSD